MLYERNCPTCGKNCVYKSEITFKRARIANTSCRSCALTGKLIKNNVKILLDESLISYYWIGFILADGHISKDYRLSVTLNNNDHEHLKLLQNYLGIDAINKFKTNYCNISAMDKTNLKILCEKYDIKHNKTYSPPNINIYKKMDNDKFMSLVIGFIDGDGNIRKQYKRKDFSIVIKNYSSWISFFKLISDRLLKKDITKINNQGYSSLIISQVNVCQQLKKFAIDNKLPIMKRKWDKIDLNYVTFYEKANEKVKKIKEIANENTTINDICEELKLKYECVFRIIKKYKIKHKKLKNYDKNYY